MAGIKLEGFQGLIPRASPRLLPPMNATVARNAKLLNGELEGFRTPSLDIDLTGQVSTLRRAFRVPDTPTDAWIAFTNRDVDVLRSPLVNDTHDRYYWAGDAKPKMNTAARIKAGDPEFILGVPTPVSAPGVVPPSGSDETRAYVYTFVTPYGEEGPPSLPTIATGDAGEWNLDSMDTTVPDQASRSFSLGTGKKKIYRTVAGQTSTSFFFVAEIDFAVSTYADNETNSVVAGNNILNTVTFIEPPTTMEGFVVMPNGYLVGWLGKRLLFSEPYRPHAWPAQYEQSTEFEIVGLGVFGSTLVICTKSQPYFGRGVNPGSFSKTKVDAVEPCLSRRSIVSMTVGVVYASINGLVLAGGNGIQVVTSGLVTKEEWSTYLPASLYASQLGLQYIAFNASNFGFIFDPQNPLAQFVELDAFSSVEGIETDRYSGNVLLLQNNRVMAWDPEGTTRKQWQWQSKLYHFPKPLNFGAARILMEAGDVSGAFDIEGTFRPYNTAYFTAITAQPGKLDRLNALNHGPLGGSGVAYNKGLVPSWTDPETRMPLGGSAMYPLNFMALTVTAVRFIAKVGSKTVLDTIVSTEKIIRMPTGFKSDLWQFELNGNLKVYSIQIAETPKQLAGI